LNSYTTTKNIDPGDEAVIELQAGIIIKSAKIYDGVWDVGSWRDDEVSYSNIQSAKSRDVSIERDLRILDELLKPNLHAGRVQTNLESLENYYGITVGTT
jgi:hypothetical protein